MTLWNRTFPKASQGFLGWFYLRPLASCRSGAASGRFNEHNRSAASLVNKVAPRVFVLETFRSWLATGGCDFLAGHHLDRPDADNAPLLRLPQCLFLCPVGHVLFPKGSLGRFQTYEPFPGTIQNSIFNRLGEGRSHTASPGPLSR